MKNLTNETVKSELFQELSEDARFNMLLKMVVSNIKKGINPVLIESWKSYFLRARSQFSVLHKWLGNNELLLLSEYDNQDIEVETRGFLRADAEKPFQKPGVMFTIYAEKKELVCKTVDATDEGIQQMLYFGNRDKNYMRLFFSEMGYEVSEGNYGSRYGLLIWLKD